MRTTVDLPEDLLIEVMKIFLDNLRSRDDGFH
jgi:hypothetical protein